MESYGSTHADSRVASALGHRTRLVAATGPPRPGTRTRKLSSATLCLVLLVVSASAATNRTSDVACAWLPWHPAALEDSALAASAAVIKTPVHLCDSASYITEFFANVTESDDATSSLRYLSARCSDGEYLGYYSLHDDLPIAETLASSTDGFSSFSGSASGILESLGEVLDPAHAWSDSCALGSLISGYQINFIPGEAILQIRLLCSDLDVSDCGALLAAEADGLGNPPSLGPDSAPSPSTSLAYVIFAIQWTSPRDLTDTQVLAALHSLSVLKSAVLLPLGQDCATSVGSDEGRLAECYQAGPMSSDAALIVISRLRVEESENDFSEALAMMGVSVVGPKFLFAAISGRSLAGRNTTSAAVAPPAATVSPAVDGGENRGMQAGLVAGCVVAGVLFVILVLLLAVLLLRRQQAKRQVAAAASAAAAVLLHHDPLPEHKIEVSETGLPSPDKASDTHTGDKQKTTSPRKSTTVPAYPSPFAAWSPAPAGAPWDPEQSWVSVAPEPKALANVANRAAIERRSRADKLHSAGRSAPLPASENTPATPRVLWTAEPPSRDVENLPACFSPPIPGSGAAKLYTRLAQDSDEIMKGGFGHGGWKVLHGDALLMPAASWKRDVLLSQSSSHPAGSPSGSPAETGARILDSGATEDWEIRPSDLDICTEPDGRYVELGTGAFGKVYKALLNDVTEVAVKRLEASSGAQRALFLREIDIHKRCRSDVPPSFVARWGDLIQGKSSRPFKFAFQACSEAHVVQFLGACIQSHCMFLVTELMDTSLDRKIHDDSQHFTWETEGKRIALDVAQALAYLHKQRVVHLDIKSRNVLLTRTGQAKIADVGLSRVLQNTYLSQVDAMGTFAYAAPELLYGGSNCSTKADIWSYGILLHEMVAREHPKRGALSDRRPESCPEHVDRLIQLCIERDPANRPSAKVIVKALQADTPEAAELALKTGFLDDASGSGGHTPAMGVGSHRRCDGCSRDTRGMPRMASMPELVTSRLTRWSCS